MHKAILSLASNLGNRTENLTAASHAIEYLPDTTVLLSSHYYETEPDDRPGYVNQCVVIITELCPEALWGACLGIEAAIGHERKIVQDIVQDTRVIDVDLLLYEGVTLSGPKLILPHPRILKRAFVMAPLAELFPDKKALGLDFSTALEKADRANIRTF